MKNITILATGGTIAGAASAADNAVYSPSQISAEQLIKTVTGIEKLANISCEQILSIGSENITDANWMKIANRANELLSQDSVDGIVITHGTDTLEETAYFLNLTIKSHKPVIMVAAMRPSTSLGADGPMNLYNAVALAANKIAVGKGVLVVMADSIFSARDVTKTSASNVEAFAANNSGRIGYTHYGHAEIYYSPTRLHTKDTEFDLKKLTALPQVDIIKMYAGFNAEIIDVVVKSNPQAIVIAGVGNGSIHQDAIPKLVEARKKGIFILRSSRVGSGFIVPNVSVDDDKHNFITTDNLSPQKARVLVKIALTVTEDFNQIKEFFSKY